MIDINAFAAANKVSTQTVFSLAGPTLEGLKQLAALNLQTIKTSFAEAAESTKASLSSKSANEFVALQTAALQAAPQKALAYANQVKATISAATAEQRAAVEAQFADAQGKFLEAFGGALKNIPGSDKTIAFAKSAVAASNTAYEKANEAAKRASAALTDKFANAVHQH